MHPNDRIIYRHAAVLAISLFCVVEHLNADDSFDLTESLRSLPDPTKRVLESINGVPGFQEDDLRGFFYYGTELTQLEITGSGRSASVLLKGSKRLFSEIDEWIELHSAREFQIRLRRSDFERIAAVDDGKVYSDANGAVRALVPSFAGTAWWDRKKEVLVLGASKAEALGLAGRLADLYMTQGHPIAIVPVETTADTRIPDDL